MCPWFVLLGLAITDLPEKQVSTEKKRCFDLSDRRREETSWKLMFEVAERLQRTLETSF